MEIKVDEAMVSKAIFDSLTKEDRDKLVTDAISTLIHEKPKESYGSRRYKSHLAEIFDQCVFTVAREVVNEELRKPETRTLLAGAVQAAMIKALDPESADYQQLISTLAGAIGSAWVDRS